MLRAGIPRVRDDDEPREGALLGCAEADNVPSAARLPPGAVLALERRGVAELRVAAAASASASGVRVESLTAHVAVAFVQDREGCSRDSGVRAAEASFQEAHPLHALTQRRRGCIAAHVQARSPPCIESGVCVARGRAVWWVPIAERWPRKAAKKPRRTTGNELEATFTDG